MRRGQQAHSQLQGDAPAFGGVMMMLYRQLGIFLGLLLLLVIILAALALGSWNVADPSLSYAGEGGVTNMLGYWGAVGADLAMQFLGLGSVLALLAPFFWSLLLIAQHSIRFLPRRTGYWLMSVLFFSTALAALPFSINWPLPTGLGGVIGDKLLALFTSFEVFLPILAIKMLVITVCAPLGLLSAAWAGGVMKGKKAPAPRRKKRAQEDDIDAAQRGGLVVIFGGLAHLWMWLFAALRRLLGAPRGGKNAPRIEPAFERTVNKKPKQNLNHPMHQRVEQPSDTGDFALPHLDFLSQPKLMQRDETLSRDALAKNSEKLSKILEDFGVKGVMINVRPGPVVTLYEFEPAPGIKSSRIISLADDIARSMSAVSARIAVIAGRNAIGIELPNKIRQMVYLREIFESESFYNSSAKLALALGKTIGGEAVIADIAKMPHVLVAGTTGSGKSVAINTMIMSLVYRLTPQQCRLIMVDPKMLELSVYDGIPHLLTPVVTDPKKAIVALKWAVREMEERYRKMAKIGVRNIDGFNVRLNEAHAKQETLSRTVQTGFDKETGKPIFEREDFDFEPMPYIVVIIDEMADLMMVAGKEIEAAVQRLAQMARAAGIHVIMATQRPSVDVITGTIKANFPTRISFAVTSKIDSRTILGEQGAEQLLGQGDMLFMMGGGRIGRVHGPFIGDDEVEQVVAHLKMQGVPDYLEAVMEEEEGDGDSDDFAANAPASDDPYAQAVAVVLRDRKASTSYIQRRLGIGYNRAASIIERMEVEGIVSPANHAGKREILLENPDDFDED